MPLISSLSLPRAAADSKPVEYHAPACRHTHDGRRLALGTGQPLSARTRHRHRGPRQRPADGLAAGCQRGPHRASPTPVMAPRAPAQSARTQTPGSPAWPAGRSPAGRPGRPAIRPAPRQARPRQRGRSDLGCRMRPRLAGRLPGHLARRGPPCRTHRPGLSSPSRSGAPPSVGQRRDGRPLAAHLQLSRPAQPAPGRFDDP